MARMLPLFVLLLSSLLFTTALMAAPPGLFNSQLTTDRYNLSFTLQRDANAVGGAQLYFEWKDKDNYLRMVVTADKYTVEEVKNSIVRKLGDGIWTIAPDAPFSFSIMRRGNELSVEQSEAVIWSSTVSRAPGKEAGITLDAGWVATNNRLQRLSAVDFADNFMRTPEEPDMWTVQSGKWALQSAWDNDPHGNANKNTFSNFAANPFAWIGNNPNGVALCTTGNNFWEDYTMTVAAHPMPGCALGIVVNMTDDKHGLLLRWTAASDRGPVGNTLGLYKYDDGALTAINEVKGGFIPEKWVKIAVESRPDGVRVFIDGQQRISVAGISPWRGAVGLYTEGAAGVVFDDVTVYGNSLNTDIKAEMALAKITEKFSHDNAGHLQQWSAPKDWLPLNTNLSYKVYRLDTVGDQWISATVHPALMTTNKVILNANVPNELWLALNSDGIDVNSGYRALVVLAPDRLSTQYTLYRGKDLLVTASGDALVNNEEYNFRLWHMGDKVYLEQDGNKVLMVTDTTPMVGVHPAYRAVGCFLKDLKDPLVMSHNVLDYIFDDAPADWVNDGTWISTTRWACSPQWSFFAGWGRGDVALWQKNRFNGNHTFEAFVGIKMEYPREIDQYDDRYRDLSITICGDGKNPRTGYSGIFGAPDLEGNPGKRMIILRDGIEVASTFIYMSSRSANHRDWVHLQLQLDGNQVIFSAESYKLNYTDPTPLTGGTPAIWSTNNGISVARARIFFTNHPVPRTEPQVILNQRELPEWVNVGTPLELDFYDSWSTTGKPVTLQVIQQQVPAEEKALPTVIGKKVVFAPTAPGPHWYSIIATDGENTSPPFQLYVPVFAPALQRDDSMALVLYRFDEGSGDLVHDLSKIGNPIDLQIPAGGTYNWLPRRGLHLVKTMPLTSFSPLDKILSIGETNAGTIELWLNTDTMYPLTTDWGTNLISMGSPTEFGKINFAVGTRQNMLAIAGPSQVGTELAVHRTSLHHFVITFNDKITTIYRDGVNVGNMNIAWQAKNWKGTLPLLLGSNNYNTKSYQGTFLLAAIHDVILTADQVKKHYQAGPDAEEKAAE